MADKRDRAANFSYEDCVLLSEIVVRYERIIENKKTDGVTWSEKKKAWDQVALEYNAATLKPKTATQLTSKYLKLKQRARKKAAEENQFRRGTGGGAYKPPKFEDEDVLERIRGMIPLSCDGLPPRSDSDAPRNPDNSYKEPLQSDAESEDSNEAEISGLIEGDMDTDSLIGDYSLPVINEEDRNTAGSSTSPKWQKYTPSMLKKSKHPSLKQQTPKGKPKICTSKEWAARRRPTVTVEGTPPKSANGRKYANWAEEKSKLALTQQDLLIKEYTLRRDQSIQQNLLDVAYKELQIEILKVELEIKRKQLAALA